MSDALKPAGDRRPSAESIKPGLHLVATPIGHLGDLSPRALATLKNADVLVCEDTRVTGKLLKLHGIERSILAYHEHNAARMRPKILGKLEAGDSVALASDAGTPLVSDPGYKLVREAIAAGHEVLAIPGPSAALAALVVSGLPTDRFLVSGFLPTKSVARRRAIDEVAAVPATLIWFEAPQRLASSLSDLADRLGPRPAVVARELTKRFEEVRRETLDQLATHYAEAGAPRGEIVIVVGPPAAAERDLSDNEVDQALIQALADQSPSAAASAIAAVTRRPKRELYKRALALGAKSGATRDDKSG